MPRYNNRLLFSSGLALAASAVGTALIFDSKTKKPAVFDVDDRERSRAERIERLVQRFLVKTGAPGASVGVSVDGRLVHARGYGFADVENGVKCRAESVMRIASISKPMCASLVARLVQDGKMQWDDSIYKFLPDFPPKKFDGKAVDITIRQLLSHTGGIRHYPERAGRQDAEREDRIHANYAVGEQGVEFLSRKVYKTLTDALEMFKNDELAVRPGKYNYTTHGYTLLGACVEKAAGKPFDRHATELFRSLGMRSTFLDKNEPLIPNRAKYYRRNRFNTLVNVPEVDCSYKYAGGGILSNVSDILKFGNAMLLSFQSPNDPKAFLDQKIVEEMWLCPSVGPDYLLGWQRYWKQRPAKGDEAARKERSGVWYHTGAGVGTSSILLIKADEPKVADGKPHGICVSILANGQGVYHSIVGLALDIVDVVEDARE